MSALWRQGRQRDGTSRRDCHPSFKRWTGGVFRLRPDPTAAAMLATDALGELHVYASSASRVSDAGWAAARASSAACRACRDDGGDVRGRAGVHGGDDPDRPCLFLNLEPATWTLARAASV